MTRLVLVALAVVALAVVACAESPTALTTPTSPPSPTATATAASSANDGLIAFTSGRDGNFEVYVMDADGSDVVNLTNDPADDRFPDWSPDGTRIAFDSFRDDRSGGIYVLDADGTDVVRLTHDGTGDYHPVWSPDRATPASLRPSMLRPRRR